mgnify:CR=1 FL=1
MERAVDGAFAVGALRGEDVAMNCPRMTLVAATSAIVALCSPEVRAEQRATVADGRWSDLNTWGGTAPAPGDQVSVRHRLVVDVDVEAADILVRRGGALEATTAVTLRVPGAIVAQDGSRVLFHGPELVPVGQVGAVVSETEDSLTVRAPEWAGLDLVGATVHIRGGRARTWRFTVDGQDADTLTLALPYPNGRGEVMGVTSDDGASLEMPAGFIDGPGAQVQGRWVDVGAAAPSLVLGAHDRPDGNDRIVLWPPPVGATSVRMTYGLAGGDRYSAYRPVRLLTSLVHASDGAQVSLRRVAIESGFIQTERTVGFELIDSDLHGADPGCFVLGRDVTDARIVGNFIHDVSPDSDLVEFGGRWRPEQQRGHGICLYGAGHLVADNLLTNLNDDMIYIGASTDVVIRDNIALGSGIYHGNSFECITAFQVDGELLIEGNIAGGAQLALLFEDRASGSRAQIRSNLFLQDDGRAVLADRSGDGAGMAVFENNVFVGAAERAVYVQAAGAPALYRANYFHDTTVRDAAQLLGNLHVSTGRVEQPMLRDPGVVESSLFLSPSQRARHATVLVGAGTRGVELRGNSFDPGLGAVVRHEPASGVPVSYVGNLSLGPLIGFGSAADPSAQITDNVVVQGASLWEAGSLFTPEVVGNRVVDVQWAERSHLVPACAPGAGFDRAGIERPAATPLHPTAAFRARVVTATQRCGEQPATQLVPPVPAHRQDDAAGCSAVRGAHPWWLRRR